MSGRLFRHQNSSSHKSRKSRNRILRGEQLEPRAMLSGNGISSPIAYFTSSGSYAISGMIKAVNAAPTVARQIIVNGNQAVTGRTASLTVLGNDDAGEAKLVYKWSVTSSPAGGSATFNLNGTNGAKNATVAFTKAGTYNLSVKIVDGSGLSVTAVKSVVVTPTITSIKNLTSVINVSGTTVQLPVPTFADQFGNAMPGPITLSWSTSGQPSGAPAPSFKTSGSAYTATFGMAGYYILTARLVQYPSVSYAIQAVVNQTLTSIAVSPNTASIFQGATQQFIPQALDQFQRAMSNLQTYTWSASGGTISASGLFKAPNSASVCTVTARCGSATGTATINVVANSGSMQNAALAKLVTSLDADGSISRLDMIQILRSVGGDGVVDTTEFGDLKKILSQAGTLNIPGYVQILAGDVINGNAANATYQGLALGNLAAGSSAAQLNKLIDKWFLGADHPVLCNTSLVYKSAAGSLFAHAPSHADEFQGQLGDCYFISALGTLADSNPAAVQNMFIDNGDGTFTVRFYTGTYGTIYNYGDGSISAGFTNNIGTVDYITVDRMLPTTTSGMLVYANYGASYNNSANTLWIALAEKAYAQWNQTGKEGRDGLNAYASIQGGWMATVDAQVLGYNATDYIMTSTSKQVAINALAAKKAVTIGTQQWTGTNLGLYASHAYAIVGYNASTDTFTLYNPWGSNQPGQLTWSQLQATCTQMAVADTSRSTPIIGAAAVKAVSVKASFSQVSDDMAGILFRDSAQVSDNVAGVSHRESAAIYLEYTLPSATARRGNFSSANSATHALFETLGSNWTNHLRQASLDRPLHGILSASFVDATFAASGMLVQSEVLETLV
jgi:Calpain family cysteine protease